MALAHTSVESLTPSIEPFYTEAAALQLKWNGVAMIDGDIVDNGDYSHSDYLEEVTHWRQATDTQHDALLEGASPISEAFDVLDAHLLEHSALHLGTKAVRTIHGLSLDANSKLPIHKDKPNIDGAVRLYVPQARKAGNYLVNVWKPGTNLLQANNKKPDTQVLLSTERPVVVLLKGKQWNEDVIKAMAESLPPHSVENLADHTRYSATALHRSPAQ